MAAFISIQPTDFFNALIYTGNYSDGHAITGVGFQPDMVWVKDLTGSNHIMTDAARGAGKTIQPNTTAAETTEAAKTSATACIISESLSPESTQ